MFIAFCWFVVFVCFDLRGWLVIYLLLIPVLWFGVLLWVFLWVLLFDLCLLIDYDGLSYFVGVCFVLLMFCCLCLVISCSVCGLVFRFGLVLWCRLIC